MKLSIARVKELHDYVSDYGAFREDTPNGVVPDGSRRPMDDIRRDEMRALEELLELKEWLEAE